MRVFVYYNLHRHCLSCKALEGPQKGRVILHAAAVRLSGVQFKVSAAGRARVLRERCKNVHAGVVGQLDQHWIRLEELPAMSEEGERVTYNPYRFDSFVLADDHRPIYHASECLVRGRDVRVWAD